MARNKYPEETINLILHVAEKLFIEKGYDNTSVQDMLNELGGLSKGAIYHHFKSKEEILIAVMDRREEQIKNTLFKIIEDTEKNGFEKLKNIFGVSILNLDKEIVFQTIPNLRTNPRMLVMQIESIFNEIVPDYVQPIIEEGIKDGSIQTDYPKELSEVLVILSNIWLSPLIVKDKDSLSEIYHRIQFYQILLKKLGIDIIDDEMVEHLQYLVKLFYDNKI